MDVLNKPHTNSSELDDSDIDIELDEKTYIDSPPIPSTKSVAHVARRLNSDGFMQTMIRARKSEFVSKLIHLNGAPFDFEGRNYLRPVYDGNDSQILLKTARQVEKTTFLGNNLTISGIVRSFNKSLYVSPSHTQTRQFSSEKLKPAIEFSPFIKRYFTDHSVSSMVFEKGFTNGSYIFLRSAFRSADRTRGISARDLCLDELQDFVTSEIPVIMECTSHFPDATVLMAGTPKTFDNPIEVYWQSTSQNEWMVPCYNHSPTYWNFLDEANIAPSALYFDKTLPPGPVCKKCQKPIDPTKGRWMTFKPGQHMKGYRISQLMVPWIYGLYEQWLKLLWKRDNYPAGQFNNEVLGLSYDNASKPVSRDELIACCDPQQRMLPDNPSMNEIQWAQSQLIFGGLDIGEGIDGSEKSPVGKVRHASYTVLTLGVFTELKRFHVIYVKKYTGKEADPDYVIKDIVRICKMYNVKLLAADWGHGFGINNFLARELGNKRLVQVQYVPKMRERQKFDPISVRFLIQRNLIISEMFYKLKERSIIFPAWRLIEPYAKDILAEFAEYSEMRRMMVYNHRASEPDDFLHSLILSHFAGEIYLGHRWQT